MTTSPQFPFLFGGTFIEGDSVRRKPSDLTDFPSFSEGLSLRDGDAAPGGADGRISLPFRRDFH